MPSSAGSPTCTGAPCTAGITAVSRTASATRSAGIWRIDTTIGPCSRPAGSHCRFVTYIATLRPWSTCRSGTPPARSAVSNVKLQPIENATMSLRHKPVASVTSPVSTPLCQIR